MRHCLLIFILQILLLMGCGPKKVKLSAGFSNVVSNFGEGEFENEDRQNHVVFYQRIRNEIDIAVIDDNSWSMTNEQRGMGRRFPNLLEGLGRLSWQLAITTTDVSNGRYGLDGRFVDLEGGLGQILDYQTPQANQIFQSTIVRQETLRPCSSSVESCPSPFERPILALIRVMERHNSDNFGFFRRDADFVAIIISDEDEPSPGEHEHFGDNKRVATPDDAIKIFQNIWGFNKNFTVYAIIIKPNVGRDKGASEACFRQQSGGFGRYAVVRYGRNIAELVHKTGGELGSICASDYAFALRSIGQKSRRMLSSIQLPHIPVGDVEVLLNQQPLPEGVSFSIEGNKLSLRPLPPEGTRIDVYYNY